MSGSLPTVRVYVAGPLFGSGRSTANLHRAIQAAERIRAARMWPFVPHLFHTWDTISPHDDVAYWLDMDRVWLESCDVMVRLHGESPGSSAEEGWCRELGIRVYHEGNGNRGLSQLVSDFAAGLVCPRGGAAPDPVERVLSAAKKTSACIEAGAFGPNPDRRDTACSDELFVALAKLVEVE